MKKLDAKGVYYKQLNRIIRSALSEGATDIEINNVLGQRYIGGGINSTSTIQLFGTPGQDLGAFMNGLNINVYGNAQDGVGNTMNSGKIVVHGKAGEIPGHSMRGGKVFIKGDVEYRAGIHMKEYQEQIPWLLIGGTAKDYCGEYMAGGRVVILNLNDSDIPVGYCVGTGIHGGAIYVRGKIEEYQLGRGAIIADLIDEDFAFLTQAFKEYTKELGANLSHVNYSDFIKITKKGHRPFGKLYTSGINVKHKKPKHLNLTPPCVFHCPSNIVTPVYLDLIRNGKVKDAQLLMDEFTPFRFSVCGTVCPGLCMTSCSRKSVDKAIDIPTIAKEYYPDFKPIPPKENRSEKISIIGAGPAGLSAAWQLARRGYQITVYDRTDDLGGKLRKAIPRERLTDDVLDQDIGRIKTYPIDFKLNQLVDKESFKEIYKNSDAVIVAVGAHVPKRIPYPGGERIISGLEFLVDINEGRPIDLTGKEVAIVGAGNVGMDIACESWRLGAKRVTAIDIQKPLAFGKELEMATELGTELLWPMKIDKLDKENVYFDDGTTLKADVVFFSIGEVPDTSFLPESVMLDERGYMMVGNRSFKSTDPKVFGCGDILKPGLVTDAVGNGRLASMEVHASFNSKPFIYPTKKLVPKRRINLDYFGGEHSEADKCISCGTCIFCDKCVEECPQEAITRNGEIFTVDPTKCTSCYTCVQICPRGALQNQFFEDFENVEVTIED